ncbi:Uma2 family endonuclease [Nocardia sp. NPDC050712]|uniref:Uma2 family endonuclease n=1 Tax=Nocardia sp. NPDC050712 TaxID=3155518 RepID=UPI0033F85D5F
MTALPEPEQRWPAAIASRRPLTISDYLALGEDDQFRWELQEGVLVMSPSPTPSHQKVGSRLDHQLEVQLPPELMSFTAVDVDLELVPEEGPATVRCPDLVVVDTAEHKRVQAEGGILRASHVHLAIEIVSPGSRRMDNKIKRSEYADAGIAQYWIIDLTPPISLLPLRLTEELGYVDNGEVTGAYTTELPCRLTIELDRLVR